MLRLYKCWVYAQVVQVLSVCEGCTSVKCILRWVQQVEVVCQQLALVHSSSLSKSEPGVARGYNGALNPVRLLAWSCRLYKAYFRNFESVPLWSWFHPLIRLITCPQCFPQTWTLLGATHPDPSKPYLFWAGLLPLVFKLFDLVTGP